MNTRHNGLLVGLALGCVLSIVFAAGFVAGTVLDRSGAGLIGSSSDPNLRQFVAAYQLVTKRSYFRPFDQRRLIYAAIDGMLAATGDPHTIFLSPGENKIATSELNGSDFGGIGAIVVPSHHALEVVVPLPGSPAAHAGLKPGDIVTRIDGKAVAHMVGDTAVAHIHGRSGTSVRLTVVRHHAAPVTVRVRRARIPAITAYGRLLSHHLGYIQILSFGDNTSAEVSQAVAMLAAHHVRGVVLDMRENPGGFVDAAQRVVSLFVRSGVVAYERTTNKQLQPLDVLKNQRRLNVPIAILVDAGTASAAEITAAALRDNAHAEIIGTRTYGKGSMQSVYNLGNGSSIRITDRLWLTPKKRSIQGVGVKPDIVVRSPDPNPNSTDDPALSRAESYLAGHASS